MPPPGPLVCCLPAAVDESWTFVAANLVVRRSSSTSPALAVVQICRRGGLYETAASCAAAVDNNCDGLAGYEDPLCMGFLPPLPT